MLLTFGTKSARPVLRTLRAGALEVDVDVSTGAIGRVAFGGTCVFEGIGFLNRCAQWGTVPSIVSEIVASETISESTVRFTARAGDARIEATLAVECDSHANTASLHFDVEATAMAQISTARLGIVVLHSLSASAASPLIVDGGVDHDPPPSFPRLVADQQPFTRFKTLQHTFPTLQQQHHGRCRCDFRDCSGLGYEMEDQRLWSDASLKTYVRPLSEPWPYTVPLGEQVRQGVSVHFEHCAASELEPEKEKTYASQPLQQRGRRRRRMPAIGVGVYDSSHLCMDAVGQRQLHDALAHAAPSALVGFLGEEDLAPRVLERRLNELAELQRSSSSSSSVESEVHLEVALPSPSDDGGDPSAGAAAAAVLAIGRLGDAVDACDGLDIAALTCIPASDLCTSAVDDMFRDEPQALSPFEQRLRRSAWYDTVLAAARGRLPGTKLGGGSLTGFTELARGKPNLSGADFATHSTCAIVHDATDRAVMATTCALPHLARSCRALYPQQGYRVSPSAIALRFDPWSTQGVDRPIVNEWTNRETLRNTDPRHFGRFGAAWAVAYVAACMSEADPDIAPDQIALGDIAGPRGWLVPAAIAHGAVHHLAPAFHVLSWLASCSTCELLNVRIAAAAAGGDDDNEVGPCDRAATMKEQAGEDEVLIAHDVADAATSPCSAIALNGRLLLANTTDEVLVARVYLSAAPAEQRVVELGGAGAATDPRFLSHNAPRTSVENGSAIVLPAYGVVSLDWDS